MHIVIVNRWPRFDGADNRWDNELTQYENFIDHQANSVSYVVDQLGVDGVLANRADIAGFEQISDVNNEAELTQACRRIIAQHGDIDVLIALSEFTLEVAANVRETLAIPGPRWIEVNKYRDKVCMKQHISEAGLRAPRFTAATAVDAYDIACGWSFPQILKPRAGAASIGVRKIESAEELRQALTEVCLDDYQIEEFIDGDIYHIDGYVNAGGEVVFQSVSKYINDCLSFADGAPLASFVIGPSPIREAIEAFSQRCCEVLGLQRSPFHLEVFWHHNEAVFLEIGGRVGGAEVPHLINKIYALNLYECWLKELSGESLPPLPQTSAQQTYGGWLVFPKPEDQAYVVKQSVSLKQHNDCIWRELIPTAGQVLEPGGAYDAFHKGRFIFVTESAEQTELQIHQAMINYRCDLARIA